MIDRKKIGIVINDIRLRSGLSKKEFAVKLNMDCRNLQRIVCGEQEVSLSRLNAISKAFGIPVYEVMRRAEYLSNPQGFMKTESVSDKRIRMIEPVITKYSDNEFLQLMSTIPIPTSAVMQQNSSPDRPDGYN
jgi:transcriptional regulator with XRE-family HTH domain